MLHNFDFRVKVDFSNETLGARIKQARLDRVSFICIIGDKEQEKDTVMLRKTDDKANQELKINQIIDFLKKITVYREAIEK